jgi:hypothetical protein
MVTSPGSFGLCTSYSEFEILKSLEKTQESIKYENIFEVFIEKVMAHILKKIPFGKLHLK